MQWKGKGADSRFPDNVADGRILLVREHCGFPLLDCGGGYLAADPVREGFEGEDHGVGRRRCQSRGSLGRLITFTLTSRLYKYTIDYRNQIPNVMFQVRSTSPFTKTASLLGPTHHGVLHPPQLPSGILIHSPLSLPECDQLGIPTNETCPSRDNGRRGRRRCTR